jgi:hypothetical protein
MNIGPLGIPPGGLLKSRIDGSAELRFVWAETNGPGEQSQGRDPVWRFFLQFIDLRVRGVGEIGKSHQSQTKPSAILQGGVFLHSEMSSQNIPLKGCTDFRESSRIPATETVRV